MPLRRAKSAPQLTDPGFMRWPERDVLEPQISARQHASLKASQDEAVGCAERKVPLEPSTKVESPDHKLLKRSPLSLEQNPPSAIGSQTAEVVRRSAIEARQLSNDAIIGIATGSAGAVIGLVGASAAIAQCCMTSKPNRDKQQADIELQELRKNQAEILKKLAETNEQLVKQLAETEQSMREQSRKAEELIRNAAQLDINKLLTASATTSADRLSADAQAQVLRNQLDRRGDELLQLSKSLDVQRKDTKALHRERKKTLDSREELLKSTADASQRRLEENQKEIKALLHTAPKLRYGLVMLDLLATFKSKSADRAFKRCDDIVKLRVEKIVGPLQQELDQKLAQVNVQQQAMSDREAVVTAREKTLGSKIEECEQVFRNVSAQQSRLKELEKKKNAILDEAEKLYEETGEQEAALGRKRKVWQDEESERKHSLAIWRDTLERRERAVAIRERGLLRPRT